MGFNDTRCVMEPAGALSIAGANKYLRQHNLVGLTVAAVTSGANMDFDRLRFVSERADSSETLLSVAIPERPGESAYCCCSLHLCGARAVLHCV
jgi:threonine dehydratase